LQGGKTLLMYASIHNKIKVMQVLIEKGARLEAADKVLV
jgi:hypothetical protein